MLGPGDVLGDRYRLDEFIASGGMGQVFRATDKTLGRVVAVKVLLPGHLANAEFGSRFRSEARIMASIGHPGVVGVYDYGETPEGTLFLVMAFVDGRPLGERITAAGGTLPIDETLGIVAQAADALHAAHEKGIIHRDVKPGNLLVGVNGGVTLVDFGVARSTSVTSVTKVNAVIGTALYMSPEQARGNPISPSADIYALGVVAYHCVTGAPPFMGNSPLEIAIKHLQDEPPPLPETVPPATRALIERAMAKDPQDRYPTAASMAAAARAARDGTATDPVLVPPMRSSAPTTIITPAGADTPDDEPAGRPAWVPIVATLAVIALIAGVVLAIVALTRKVLDPNIPDLRPSASATATPTSTVKVPGNPNASHNPTPGASAGGNSATNTAPPSSPAPGTNPPASPTPATTTTTPPEPTTQAPTPPPASVEATIGNG